MPGTRPARRSARVAPLPALCRAVAFNSLTVAMYLPQQRKKPPLAAPRRHARRSGPEMKGHEAEPCGARAYSDSGEKKQGNRFGWRQPGVPSDEPALPAEADLRALASAALT